MKANAVIFPSANKYETTEISLDKVGPRDILVKTLITAISPGTERWILRGKHIGTEFPCIPGYHRIGIVEECGKEVKIFNPGDIVYGHLGRWNEKIHSMWGAHVSHSIFDYSHYEFISSEIPDVYELETLVFIIAAAMGYRGLRILEVQETNKILIIGAGFIGLCAAQIALYYYDCIPIIIDNNEERVQFAKKFTPNVLLTKDINFEKELKEIVKEGVDCIFDTAGIPEVIDMCVKHSKQRSKILLEAQYFDKEHRAIDLDQIKHKEMTIKTVISMRRTDREETIKLINRRILNIADLITHRFSYKEILQGYELLDKGSPFNMGIVFHWNKKN
jgi:2-desacetyl-2-hydroxyethyl bacteriochlorophyllide A dehydrogenase